MKTDVTNVSSAKPKVGGAVFVAPMGTTLPTDATATLDAAFESLGYCSEEGLTNKNDRKNKAVKAWGGDTVLNVMTERSDEFEFELIETLKLEVLKFVHGKDNVTGSLETGITVKANDGGGTAYSIVFELVLAEAVKRIVVPHAQTTGMGETKYVGEDAIGYKITLAAMPGKDGDSHYEYIKKAE